MADKPTTTGEDSVTMEDIAGSSELVEVYETDSDMLAGVIIDEVLAPAGITAYRHDRRSHAIPAPASMPGSVGIAVPSHLVARAQQLLAEAKADGLFEADGHVVEDEEEERLA